MYIKREAMKNSAPKQHSYHHFTTVVHRTDGKKTLAEARESFDFLDPSLEAFNKPDNPTGITLLSVRPIVSPGNIIEVCQEIDLPELILLTQSQIIEYCKGHRISQRTHFISRGDDVFVATIDPAKHRLSARADRFSETLEVKPGSLLITILRRKK